MKKKKLTLTEIYIMIVQISGILPCLYILYAAGSYSLIMRKGILAVLFDLGITALPRLCVLALSWLYRLSLNEVLVYFVLIASVLAFGLTASHFYEDSDVSAGRLRRFCACAIVIDLIIRLLPLSFNRPFALPYQIIGFAIRLACLFMLVTDIRKQ